MKTGNRIRLRVHTGRRALAIFGGIIAIGVGLFVWFLGFDYLWASAIVLAAGTVSAAIANLRGDEEASPGATTPEVPRGVRYDVATIAESLAACDRLALPPRLRRFRALLIPEGDDRIARSRALRRMQALLSAELSDHDLDSRKPSDNDAIVELLGAEAMAILHPDGSRPVTTTGIERCLAAVERLGTETI